MGRKVHKTFLAQTLLVCCLGLFHNNISAASISGHPCVEIQMRRWSCTDLGPYLKNIRREIFEYLRCLENSLGCSACKWLKKNTSKGKHVATRKGQLIEMGAILADPTTSDGQKIQAIWIFFGTIKGFAKFQGDAGRNFLYAMERLERDFALHQNVIRGRL